MTRKSKRKMDDGALRVIPDVAVPATYPVCSAAAFWRKLGFSSSMSALTDRRPSGECRAGCSAAV